MSPSTTRRTAFLGTRFGRRLFAVFFLCALLPIGVGALLAARQVGEALLEQSGERLRRASKAAGMLVIARLIDLETELAAVHAVTTKEGTRVVPLSERRRERLERVFRRVVFAGPGGERLPVVGVLAPLPALPARRTDGLGSARLLVEGAGGALRLFLARPEDAGWVVGEARVAAVLDISADNALPPDGGFLLIDESRRLLAASPRHADERVADLPSGHASAREVTLSGEPHVVAAWSVFLESAFGHPAWTLVATEPRAAVLAPIARFRMAFLGAVALTVLGVALASTREIRRSLVPLERLREGTGRIARREFDARVEVETEDEFQELADAFNVMAHDLGQQFRSLAKLVDIDRTILSATDETGIARALLERAPELHSCHALEVVLDAGSEGWVRYERGEDGGVARREAQPPDAAALGALGADAAVWEPEPSEALPEFVRSIVPGAAALRVLPLRVGGELAGWLTLANRVRWPDGGGGRALYARQLVDQAALALANVRARERSRVLAYYDEVTALPNRLMLMERLGRAIERVGLAHAGPVLCMVRLTDFHRVNETLGFEAGDAVLCQVAARLAEVGTGSVHRVSGSDFAVILENLTTLDEAARLAEPLLQRLGEPFPLGDENLLLAASAGIAVFPDDGGSAEALLSSASAAIRDAMGLGRGRFQFYSRELDRRSRERLALEAELSRGIERGELRLHFQPLLDAASGEPVGAEALVRWQHPQRGMVSPAEFIPVAEESGLILPLGGWVAAEAVQALRRWLDQGLAPGRIHVNVSIQQLRAGGLADRVARLLADAAVPPALLGLELTESMLVGDDGETVALLNALRSLGVHLSIDDFGTGYSSLSYLKRLPVDALKIDQSFVRGLPGDPDDVSIVRAVIGMAHSLGLALVAEGVETEAQRAFLRAAGCETLQGYLFSMPLPEDGFGKWLRERAEAP